MALSYPVSKTQKAGGLTVVEFAQVGGSAMTARCAHGHRWIEVETLGAETGQRVSE